MKLRGSTKTIVAALFGVTMLGLVAVPSGATTSAGPVERRITTRVPLVVGPAPAHPTLVATAPKVRTPGLSAQSVNSTFIVNYDAGFNANPGAKAAFQYAVDQWANVISSAVPIEIDANFTDFTDPNILGSAGPNSIFRDFSGAPRAGTWYPSALANALHGSDLDPRPSPDGSDIGADFSSTFTGFYFGTDGNTAGKIDFASVVLHELGHGLGFLGAVDVNSGSGYCCPGGYPFIYDRYTTANGTAILSIPNGSVALGNALQGQTLRFAGPQATALNGGTAPRLYGPNPWQGGSSYSHLDESTFPAGNPNSLMTPAIGADEVIHSPGPVTLGIFADSGWTVAGLPVLSIGSTRVVEGNSSVRPARFNVSLSQPVGYDVTAHYATIANTATAGTDFVARAGTVTIPAGATTTSISIKVRGERIVEGTERFRVRLSSPGGATLGHATGTGIIGNDDPGSGLQISVANASIEEGNSGTNTMTMTVTLSDRSLNDVSVTWFTSDGTATSGSDYTPGLSTLVIPAGYISGTISVGINPDTTVEGSETFSVNIAGATLGTIVKPVGVATITDDD